MPSRPSYDSGIDGALERSQPLEIEPAPGAPRLEDLEISRRRPLESGRSVDVEPSGDGTDRVTVRAPDGRVELEVTLTEKGPVLHFRSAELDIETQGNVALRCQDFEVQARGKIRQVTEGDLEQIVFGNARLSVTGDHEASADSTLIKSKRGDVRIEANDDVRLNGERVKLNC